jgi:hypothetical protein
MLQALEHSVYQKGISEPYSYLSLRSFNWLLDANPKSACQSTNIRITAQNRAVNLGFTQDLKPLQTVVVYLKGCIWITLLLQSAVLSIANVGNLASQKQFVAKGSETFTISFTRIYLWFITSIRNAICDSVCVCRVSDERIPFL